ncbi:hypothetical protein [Yoonia sediminilitoris]|nr:hypothetical protein [Yoonia sediminilitoris]
MGSNAAAQSRGSLFQQPGANLAPRLDASLFSGQSTGSFFAPVLTRALPTAQRFRLGVDGSAVQRLRAVIGRAESPRAGYDAVQHGARIKPGKRPTQMTIGEIFDWIAGTPGQPHAIGRYQFIPDTLRRVVSQTGTQRNARFTPALQDRLADVLLVDAGFPAFMAGQLSQRQFMNNLAAIWAGLPASDGRSKYHGIAGNRATVTLAYFKSEIAKLGP